MSVSAIAVVLVAYTVAPSGLSHLELRSVDARFALRGAQAGDPGIVLVPIDAGAYQQLISPGMPPPRATVARALDAIASAHPRVVAVDIVYSGRRTPTGDRALIDAVTRNGARLVLATDALAPDGSATLFGRTDQTYTDTTTPAVGYSGFPMDPGGGATIRRIQRSVALPGGAPLHTFGVVTARAAGVPAAALASLPSTAWVAYRGGAGTFASVPFDAVLAGTPTALSRLRGRIVVLGVTAPVVGDIHDTSAPGHGRMSGPEVQANAISTALREFPLRDAGRGVDIALILALGLVPLALALRLGAARCAAALLGVAALFCIGAQLAFDAGRVIDVVYPLASLVLSGVGVLVVLLWRRRSERARAAGAAAG